MARSPSEHWLPVDSTRLGWSSGVWLLLPFPWKLAHSFSLLVCMLILACIVFLAKEVRLLEFHTKNVIVDTQIIAVGTTLWASIASYSPLLHTHTNIHTTVKLFHCLTHFDKFDVLFICFALCVCEITLLSRDLYLSLLLLPQSCWWQWQGIFCGSGGSSLGVHPC